MNKKTISASILLLMVVIAFAFTTVNVSAADNTLTITTDSTRVYVGQSFEIRGVYLEGGIPKAGITVTIYDAVAVPGCRYCHANFGNVVGSATTGDDGAYSVNIELLDAGDRVLHAVVSGTPGISTDTIARLEEDVHVATWSLTLAVPTDALLADQTFAVSGTYTEDDVGAAPDTGVEIYEVIPTAGGTQTRFITSTIPGANGEYSVTIGPLTSGDHVLQASVGGAPDSKAWAMSETQTVHINPTQTAAVRDVQNIMEHTGATSATFATANEYNAYMNKLNALAKIIAEGKYDEAQLKISNDLIKSATNWATKDSTAQANIIAELTRISNDLAELKAG